MHHLRTGGNQRQPPTGHTTPPVTGTPSTLPTVTNRASWTSHGPASGNGFREHKR
jgi:hypothetical protein